MAYINYTKHLYRTEFACLAGNRDLLKTNIVTLLWAGTQFFFLVYLILYLHQTLGMGIVTSAYMLGLATAGAVCGRLVWGILSDSVFAGKRKNVCVSIGCISTLCTCAYALLPSSTPVVVVGALAIVSGLSILSWNGMLPTLALELVKPRYVGTASGINMLAAFLGAILMPYVLGLVVELTGSYSFNWGIIAGLLGISTFLLTKIKETRVESS